MSERGIAGDAGIHPSSHSLGPSMHLHCVRSRSVPCLFRIVSVQVFGEASCLLFVLPNVVYHHHVQEASHLPVPSIDCGQLLGESREVGTVGSAAGFLQLETLPQTCSPGLLIFRGCAFPVPAKGPLRALSTGSQEGPCKAYLKVRQSLGHSVTWTRISQYASQRLSLLLRLGALGWGALFSGIKQEPWGQCPFDHGTSVYFCSRDALRNLVRKAFDPLAS